MDTGFGRGLHIYYCGHEECLPGHSFGPAARPHYLMHFILRGRGVYQTTRRTYPAGPGDAFLIRPQEITFYAADRLDPWEYIWIAFDGEEADRLLHLYQRSPQQYIFHFSDPEQTARNLREIVSAFGDGANFRERMLGLFYLIWSRLERASVPPASGSDLHYLNQAKTYIRCNYGYPLRVEEIARYVGIDRTYLYRIFMRHEGLSPKQYLTDCRMQTAGRLLLDTGMSVTEVALSSGFRDAASFCRLFRTRTGKSPRQYRLEQQSKQ